MGDYVNKMDVQPPQKQPKEFIRRSPVFPFDNYQCGIDGKNGETGPPHIFARETSQNRVLCTVRVSAVLPMRTVSDLSFLGEIGKHSHIVQLVTTNVTENWYQKTEVLQMLSSVS